MSFGDLGDLFDGPHATPTRRQAGPYFLNISSLQSGRLNLGASDHVSPEDFSKWTRRVTPRAGDLLFSYETRLGEVALMVDGVQACLGRRMALLRPNLSIVDPRFLLYYYLSPDFQRIIATNAIHGATVSRIGLATMPKWRVRIPGLATQRAIAEVLGALDDKIAANDRVITTADALASAATLQHVTARSVALCEIGEITMGSSPPGASYNESGDGVPFFQGVRDFGVRSPARRVWTTAPVRTAGEGDTLLSVRAPVGRTNLATETLCIGRGLAAIRSREGKPWTLFHQIRAAGSVWAPYEAEGTVFGAINRSALETVEVPAIAPELASDLEQQLAALEGRIRAAIRENATLATTRDDLLPLLMSGKVRVRDAEKRVGEVL